MSKKISNNGAVKPKNHPLPSLIDTNESERECMDDNLAKLFIQFLFFNKALESEDQSIHVTINEILQLMKEKLRVYKVLDSRIPSETYEKIPEIVKVFFSAICETYGEAILWAYTLHRVAQSKENGIKFSDIADEMFPTGFPTKAGKDRIWDAQKGYTSGESSVDNWLDYDVAWA